MKLKWLKGSIIIISIVIIISSSIIIIIIIISTSIVIGINIAIRPTYYIFCCQDKEWSNPDLMII